MRVLGIDPGYAIVGWGVLDYAGNRFAPVDFGAVCTDAGVPFEQRLERISEISVRPVRTPLPLMSRRPRFTSYFA